MVAARLLMTHAQPNEMPSRQQPISCKQLDEGINSSSSNDNINSKNPNNNDLLPLLFVVMRLKERCGAASVAAVQALTWQQSCTALTWQPSPGSNHVQPSPQ
jgi:hypothetical protein